MKRDTKIVVSIAALVACSTFSFSPAFSDDGARDVLTQPISQLSVEDELDDFLDAKEKLSKALGLYKNANANNAQERYKNALAAYKTATVELKAAKDEIIKEFNATVTVANAELSKVKSSKPKPTAVKLAAATKIKDAKITEAVLARDAALSALGSLGGEPAKPVVKLPAPTPSPTKKKR